MVALGVLVAGCSVKVRHGSETLTPAAARTAIEAVFTHGAQAWNSGDLDAFMSDYTPDATYVTQREVVRGRAAIQARYQPRFRPGVERGTLRFEQLEVDVLGPDVVHAIAYYVLMRGDSVLARGPTSLVMKKIEGRWMIVHDHSS